MARLVGIADTKPRKRVATQTDGYSYASSNMGGCEEATLFLKRQSLCLECPFLNEEGEVAPCYKLKKSGRKAEVKDGS